jgi:hypothetical protein
LQEQNAQKLEAVQKDINKASQQLRVDQEKLYKRRWDGQKYCNHLQLGAKHLQLAVG